MAKKQLFTVTDLGGGDGGKGGIVHRISSLKKAHTILKVGGAQGSHGVKTKAGQYFNFSQFGCGTFEGTKTHLSELMVIEPYRLLQEGEELKYSWGISNVFDYLTIDANALCVTPFHTIASRLRELSRKENQKGSVGIGAGEAVIDSEKYPELTIRARELNNPKLVDKLRLIQAQKINDLNEVVQKIPDFWEEDKALSAELVSLLTDPEFTERILERFRTLGSLVKIVDNDYLRRNILQRDGVIVVESSHGILTDRYYGFHPYTTRLRTLPEATLSLLRDCGYDGDIFKFGVTRAYQIRHGAGPMVTDSPAWLEKILPNSSKENNRWQGKVRIGPLDFVALRYAIEVCGGPQSFDGLALTWFDQIQALGKWQICKSYQRANDENYFLSPRQIKVHHLVRGLEGEQITHQEELAKQLFQCQPDVQSFDVTQKTKAELIALNTETFKQELNIPARIISFGPTEDDKVCF